MLEDYCSRLQQLNKDKQDFLKLKYKTNTKTLIDKQENKYHKYILAQIAYKNKLDALFKFNIIVGQSACQKKRSAFDALFKKNHLRDSNAEKSLSKSNDITQVNSQNSSQKQISEAISNLKEKAKQTACNLFLKWIKTSKLNITKFAFKSIQRKHQTIRKVEFIADFVKEKNQFHKNVFFENFKTFKNTQNKKIDHENRENRSFIFSLNEFSQIIPYTIEEEQSQLSTSRIKNIAQIDSKFKALSESKIQEPESVPKDQNQCKQMLESFEKLKEEVLLMKSLLSQKNKQLKLKDQQIYKIKKDYENKIQTLHDEISSKLQKQLKLKQSRVSRLSKRTNSRFQKSNDSYLKQLQAHIIGDRTSRGNQFDEDLVSNQLLQKYMKESFELRQKMDMARQMCEQFEFDSRTDEGQIMTEIIQLLTPEERLNAFVD